MFQLKLQEFEFIRKTAENIFFVAHRHVGTSFARSDFLYFIKIARVKMACCKKASETGQPTESFRPPFEKGGRKLSLVFHGRLLKH